MSLKDMLQPSSHPPFLSVRRFYVEAAALGALILTGFAGIPLFAQTVPTAFAPSGVAGGGYILNAAVNPEDPSNLLLGCDMMGFYRSTTKGQSWRLIPSGEFSMFRRGDLQFAGTGGSQRVYGLQRFRWDSEGTVPAMSLNRGLTWQALGVPSDPSAADAYYGLAVDPESTSASGQRMVMDNWRKLWFTADGGSTWTLIHEHPGATGPGVPSSIRLAGAFWDGDNIYVGTNLGTFVSTNGGLTWAVAAITGTPLRPQGSDPAALAPVVDFCGARHPDTGVVTLFAIFLDDTAENNADVRQLDEFTFDYFGLYTATLNGSPAWTPRPGPSGEKFARVDVPFNNSTRPWAVTKHNDGQGPRIFKSNDGGLSWTNTFHTSSNANIHTGFQGDGGTFSWYYGAVSFSLDVSDSNPDVVLVSGTWPYLTEDGGATWNQVFVHRDSQNPAGSNISRPKAYRQTGLGVTTSHWMHWFNEDTALVCSTDIGFQHSDDGGRTWTSDHAPTGSNGLVWSNWYALAQQPQGTRLYAAVADINDFYEPERLDDAWVNGHAGGVMTSVDGGLHWTGSGGSLPGPVVGLDVDPAEPDHVYAAVASSQSLPSADGGIFRSTNLGASWTKLASPPRTEGRAYNIKVLGMGQLLATFCARTVNDAPQPSSGVFYSTDGGASWLDRSHADMHYYTRDVAVVPSSPTTHWFVSVQSHVTGGDSFSRVYDGRGGVFRTTDSGASWTRIFPHQANQPLTGAQSVTYVPGTAPLLYVTTAADGLWVSMNPDAAAPTFTKIANFPFHRVRRVFQDVRTSDGAIWVTTQGGGLWRSVRSSDASAHLIRNGATFDFQLDVCGEQVLPPELWASQDLSPMPGGWTLLSGLQPQISTTLSGLTRYQWDAVNTHPYFTGLQRWFLRASLDGEE